MAVYLVVMCCCSTLVALLPTILDRIQDWNARRTFPWWRYRIYWESWLDTDDRPIEVSKDWALERIRLANKRPAIELGMAVRRRTCSNRRISMPDGKKAIRFEEKTIPGDDEFSYYRVRRPLTRWRAITGQAALDTIGKHGMDVAVGMERLHDGEILRAGPYRVLATPISEHVRP